MKKNSTTAAPKTAREIIEQRLEAIIYAIEQAGKNRSELLQKLSESPSKQMKWIAEDLYKADYSAWFLNAVRNSLVELLWNKDSSVDLARGFNDYMEAIMPKRIHLMSSTNQISNMCEVWELEYTYYFLNNYGTKIKVEEPVQEPAADEPTN